MLTNYNTFENSLDALNHGIFQSISIATTAGFSSIDYSNWPIFLTLLLLFFSCIGGCAGSTGGGIKVIRILLLYIQGNREIKRLIHPRLFLQKYLYLILYKL